VHIVPIEMQHCILLYMSMYVMYCALRVGFLNVIVIGCIVVPFPYIILVVAVLLSDD
jgi:hypothetical protein